MSSEVFKCCNYNCWWACAQDSPVTKSFPLAFTRVGKNSSLWVHHTREFCWKLITCGQCGLAVAGFCLQILSTNCTTKAERARDHFLWWHYWQSLCQIWNGQISLNKRRTDLNNRAKLEVCFQWISTFEKKNQPKTWQNFSYLAFYL